MMSALVYMCVFSVLVGSLMGEIGVVKHATTRFAVYPGEYGIQAVQNLTAFRSQILNSILQPGIGQADGHSRYNQYPVTISCPPDAKMSKYGGAILMNIREDGHKFLCDVSVDSSPSSETCVIYSLGSNGEYSFERAMLAATPCEVYTFDCTYSGTSIDPRHHYKKLCIGQSPDPAYRTWARLAAELGHTNVRVLKIDIEGGEYDMLSHLRETHTNLPKQIAVEFHITNQWTISHVAHLMMHLSNLGYAIISRDDNYFGNCCTEYSFLKVEKNVYRPSRGDGGGRHALNRLRKLGK